MSRIFDRQKALELRKKGKSYSQIKKLLRLSKSTLSLWLRDYPLTKEQIDLLRGKNPKRIEKYRETMRLKREKRLQEIYEQEKIKLLKLTKKELLIAGLFLYWGEGSKVTSSVSINNTDPKVVKFAFYWLTNSLGIPREKIRVYLHLYKDMDVNKEMEFWSKDLKLPLDQFSKPYIKSSNRENLTHKGFGHGTCGLAVHNSSLKEHIIMGINAMADYYASKI